MTNRIAYLTDTHLGDPTLTKHGIDGYVNLQRVVHDIQQEGIASVVAGGDIGKSRDYAGFFQRLQPFSLYLTLGNHDRFADAAPYFSQESEGKKELYYSTDDAYCKYLFLDSSSESISDSQLGWLATQLQTDKTILLFIHHPVLAVDTAMDRIYPLKNREAVQQCLCASGRQVTIFCGHYHLPDERTAGNIRQLITPAVSFQIEKDAPALKIIKAAFGYRIIELREGNRNDA